tara:strand:- start:974 stop:1465 length:492 start_codon:yes stop_codon:yes gene_type:complete
MNHLNSIQNKIYTLPDLERQMEKWKSAGDKIVFTNGCFDILHKGHIEVLAKTSNLGNRLIIGVNSDSSMKNLKGENRPIIEEDSRALLLAALQFVDAVILFSEETPFQLISEIVPDILAKGGDYKIEEIVGYEVVQQNGGEVITIPLTEGVSSSNIIDKIQNG